eukprot:m.353204 g.353204  ORF g.353204 m.353204 type:complete len:801 (+) comp16706_c0_seq1:2-2404(+)
MSQPPMSQSASGQQPLGRHSSSSSTFDQPSVFSSQPTLQRQDSSTSNIGVSFNLLGDRRVLSSSPFKPPTPQVPEAYKRVNCKSKVIRSSLAAVPETGSLLSKSGLPFSLHVYPFAADAKVPVVSNLTITRCRSCRTYINPFASFVQGGVKWRCNICARLNDLPSGFDYDRRHEQVIDRATRPDINSSSVEFVAPADYMVRPPQPCVYLFLIDTSSAAVLSGMVRLVCETIRSQLDSLTGDDRTRVGIITYDATVSFYSLNSGLSMPRVLVMTDVDDPFLPLTEEDLLVPLVDSKALVDQLLQTLPSQASKVPTHSSCLGTALLCAKQLLQGIGGRITVFQASLCNHGPGKLEDRADQGARATDKEKALLFQQTDFYKEFSVETAHNQLAVDLFAFTPQYKDLTTLRTLVRYGGGSLFYYPDFNAGNTSSAMRVRKTLTHYLTRPIGLEAVMRVRCSRGLSFADFHGHCYVRSVDLLALANVSPDHGFTYQVAIDEKLGTRNPYVYFQCAVLFTSANGQRRIRVHTLALPVVKELPSVYHGADAAALISLQAQLSCKLSESSGITKARKAVTDFVTSVAVAYRKNCMAGAPSGQLLVPDSLKIMPLLANALLRSDAFRLDASITHDQRVYAMTLFRIMPLWEQFDFIYPRLYAMHSLGENIGVRDERNRLQLPPLLQLSSEKLERAGIFLLDTSQNIYLLVGSGCSPQMLKDVFDVEQIEEIDTQMAALPKTGGYLNQRFRAILAGLQALHTRFPPLKVIPETSRERGLFVSLLHDDRTSTTCSYYEFLSSLQTNVSKRV